MSFENVGKQKKPCQIVIHHSGNKNDTYDGILRYHEDKWGTGVGYNWLIYQERVRVGRPTYHIGAHSSQVNNGSVGFCFVGNYEDSLPTEKALEAGAYMVAIECSRYGIKPEKVVGHREVGSTDCPGDALFNYLPTFRELVSKYLQEIQLKQLSQVLKRD